MNSGFVFIFGWAAVTPAPFEVEYPIFLNEDWVITMERAWREGFAQQNPPIPLCAINSVCILDVFSILHLFSSMFVRVIFPTLTR